MEVKNNCWYKNKKNNEKYMVVRSDVINTTNSNDGEKMVLYSKRGIVFVRNYDEFIEKFEATEL